MLFSFLLIILLAPNVPILEIFFNTIHCSEFTFDRANPER
jgi:hypothetical protein